MIMRITDWNVTEWERMGVAAFEARRYDVLARMGRAAASLTLPIREYDAVMAEYRQWLVFGLWASADTAAD